MSDMDKYTKLPAETACLSHSELRHRLSACEAERNDLRNQLAALGQRLIITQNALMKAQNKKD